MAARASSSRPARQPAGLGGGEELELDALLRHARFLQRGGELAIVLEPDQVDLTCGNILEVTGFDNHAARPRCGQQLIDRHVRNRTVVIDMTGRVDHVAFG